MNNVWLFVAQIPLQCGFFDNKQKVIPMNQPKILTVKCPNCAAPVEWLPENAFRPFCSETCRLIDLGEWANDTRAIACTPNAEDWTDLPE